jgi:photosystem II stability/assembly factor-like uncharacterized protein
MRLALCRAAQKSVLFFTLCLSCGSALAGVLTNPDWIFGTQSGPFELISGSDGLLRWRAAGTANWHEEKLGEATVDMALAAPSGGEFLALSKSRVWHGAQSAAGTRWTPVLEDWQLSKIAWDNRQSSWLAWGCRSDQDSACAVLSATAAGQSWRPIGQGNTPALRLLGVDAANRAVAAAHDGSLWISENEPGAWQELKRPKGFAITEVVDWKRAGPWWAGMTRDRHVLLINAVHAKAFAVNMPTDKPGTQGSGWTAAAYDEASATLMLGGADGRIALLATAGHDEAPRFILRAATLPYIEQLAFDVANQRWLALSNDGQLFSSSNAGLDWHLAQRFGQARANGMALAADGQLLLWGNGGFIARHKQSAGWTLEQPDLSRYINHVLRSPSGTLIAVGIQGLIARAEGATGRRLDWQVVDAGLAYGQYLTHALAYPDRRTLLATGSAATIIRSTDDGASWQTVFKHADGALGNFQRIAIHPRSSVALVIANPGWVMRSADEGASWQNAAGGAVMRLKDVMALPDAGFVAVGEGGIVAFFDAQGQLQSQRSISSKPVWYQIREAAGALWVMGDGNKLLRISPDGRQLDEIALGQHFLARDIISPAKDVLILAGAKGTLLRSVDGGQHWQSIQSGVEANLRRLLPASDGGLWVTGRDGVLLHSGDAGRSWQAIDSGTRHHFKDGLLLPNAQLMLFGERLLTRPAGIQ